MRARKPGSEVERPARAQGGWGDKRTAECMYVRRGFLRDSRSSQGLEIPKFHLAHPTPPWSSPPILEDTGLVSGRAWESRVQFAMIAWAPYRGIFLIHRSIAYAHRYGGACNSRGVLRGRASGLCTTNMERSITEARLPREIAQSSAPVSFADSTRAASRTVPPAADLHRLHLPVARDFFSVLSALWDF